MIFNRWKIPGLIAFLSLFIFSVSTAHALLIDFTDGTDDGDSQNWSAVEGTTGTVSKVIGGLLVNVSASGAMSFNGGSSESPGQINLGGGISFDGDGDGLGISGRDWDEVDSGEKLTVSFGHSVLVSNIYVLDLFSNEIADFSFSSSSQSYLASSNSSWGFHDIPVSFILDASDSLEFSVLIAPDDNQGDSGDHNYSIAGIHVAPVPEPQTMLLFGTGLAGLAGLRLRRKK